MKIKSIFSGSSNQYRTVTNVLTAWVQENSNRMISIKMHASSTHIFGEVNCCALSLDRQFKPLEVSPHV